MAPESVVLRNWQRIPAARSDSAQIVASTRWSARASSFTA